MCGRSGRSASESPCTAPQLPLLDKEGFPSSDRGCEANFVQRGGTSERQCQALQFTAEVPAEWSQACSCCNRSFSCFPQEAQKHSAAATGQTRSWPQLQVLTECAHSSSLLCPKLVVRAGTFLGILTFGLSGLGFLRCRSNLTAAEALGAICQWDSSCTARILTSPHPRP